MVAEHERRALLASAARGTGCPLTGAEEEAVLGWARDTILRAMLFRQVLSGRVAIIAAGPAPNGLRVSLSDRP